MEKPDRLAEIKSRWRVGHFLNEWRHLPLEDREEVVSWLEDETRDLSSSPRDRRLYRGLLTVLDVLDSIDPKQSLGAWEVADDIDWLVEELDKTRAKVRPQFRRSRGGGGGRRH
ncbi:MAG: hypothetical protein ACYCW6_06550 [Candidatus Xenobia bacterium]